MRLLADSDEHIRVVIDTSTIEAPNPADGGELVPAVRPDPAPRRARHARRRADVGLPLALTVTVGVPLVVLGVLWRNLSNPFWFNEQWRAYYISKPMRWWEVPASNNAPFPLGWYALERASATVFGSTEFALRFPTAIFLPLTCVLLMLLARRFMPLAAAVVVALLGGLTGTLTSYAIQLSEYQVDAAAVVAVILLHETAADVDPRPWRSVRVYASYGGIALACLMSTPAVLVAGPVLAVDAWRAWRARHAGAHLVSAAVAGAIALVHLGLYVAPQNALTKGQDWAPQFLPHRGLGRQVAFVWDGLRGFVTGTFTGSDAATQPQLLTPRLAWIAALALTVLLGAGIAAAVRTASGWVLLAGVGGSLGLTLVASYARYWPFGFVRTNFYLVPLLILLAGIGATGTTRALRERIRSADAGGRRSMRTSAVVTAVVLGALVVSGTASAASYEVGSVRQLRDSGTADRYGGRIIWAVDAVRHHAAPGAALVVSGSMATQGWAYYLYEYAGAATEVGHQVARSRTVFTTSYGSTSISRVVRRARPTQLFVYVPRGSDGSDLGRDFRAVTAGGAHCRTSGDVPFPYSGLLVELSCSYTE